MRNKPHSNRHKRVREEAKKFFVALIGNRTASPGRRLRIHKQTGVITNMPNTLRGVIRGIKRERRNA